ncbi:autoinducer-2 kinase [Thalassospira lucentensis]|uniref:autoinducer-2 kinase n=1 Tax=Thalassospira lucentensis TaxID=168935 RepID=UPI003D270BD1|tara:strand:- start:45204 stop:46769 length:1566 start_codon:yes stop_codon:yes gene_type:complete
MSAGDYLLAIDAGTGSGRAVVFDQDGNQRGSCQREWWHKEDPRFPGSMDFDVDGNWQLICDCIAGALSEAKISGDDIAAVSATSMREAIVAFDEDGQEIWACANVDGRAVNQVRQLKDEFPGVEEDLYKQTGQTFALGAVPRLLWLRQQMPDIYDRIDRVAMLSDWVVARLSGVIASDPSNAGTTGIFGLRERNWLPDAMRAVGLRDDIFPPAHETGTAVGHVTAKAAFETGLSTKTTVVVGGGDCQLGTAGLGVTGIGDCAVLGGTFWQQIVNVDSSLIDPSMNLRINPHVITGLNQAEAISFFVGAVMRWFRDAFGQEELAKVDDPGKAYTLLEKLSTDVPLGAHGVIPIFSDVMRYGSWYHAAPSFLNLSIDPAKSGKAVLFRALQENACIVAARNLEAIFTLSGKQPDKIVFAAGAAKSPHWSQMLADVTGIPVATPVIKEATALGCAAAAAVGGGLHSDLAALGREWVRWENTFEPNTALKSEYDQLGDRWAQAYAAQRQLVDQGVTTSMWKAPGL